MLLKRRLTTWSKRPWLLPDFFNGQKKNFLIGGEVISVSKKLDEERILASKSKKIKSVYGMMQGELSISKLVSDYKQGISMLGRSIQ